MAIVTISRGTFSGGKMLAECLGRTLGYPCIDRDMLVKTAATASASEFDLRAALEQPPQFPGRFSHKRYIYLALMQAALAERVRGGDAVYHAAARVPARPSAGDGPPGLHRGAPGGNSRSMTLSRSIDM
jgi:hypothetical protein